MKKEDLGFIEHKPGVYIFRSRKGQILYIGKANDLKKRVLQYFSPGSVWKQDMVKLACTLETIYVDSQEEALLLEEQLIQNHQPDYNRLLKNNSQYGYLRVGAEKFGKVTFVRKRKKDGATYIGPKRRGRSIQSLMKFLRRMYKWREMSDKDFKKGVITLDYHLGLDSGWSVISKLDTNHKNYEHRKQYAESLGIDTTVSLVEYETRYSKMTQQLQKLFSGYTDTVLAEIHSQIQFHIEYENFEYCAQLKEVYDFIQHRDSKHQRIVMENQFTGSLCQIHRIGTLYVILVFVLVEGKLIDVVRTHQKERDVQESTLLAELFVEFGLKKISFLGESAENCIRLGSRGSSTFSYSEKKDISALFQHSLSSYISSTAFQNESIMTELLQELGDRYFNGLFPYQMECIDISHTSGGWVSAGLSCFVEGVPQKKGYRMFKIESVESGKSDDYKSIEEVLIKRLKLQTNIELKEIDLPQVIVIDGGVGQLGVVSKLRKMYKKMDEISNVVTFVGLGKGEARTTKGKRKGNKEIVRSFSDQEIEGKPLLYDQVDRLLISLRDESHRFANKYRKMQMKQELTNNK